MTTLKFYKEASVYLSGKDKKLAKIIKQHELSPLELHEDYFRELTESIIGQQLSVKAADTILKRFYLLITGPITPEKVIRLNDEKIRKAGISYQKISYIKDLAKKFQDGEIEFKKFSKLTDEDIIDGTNVDFELTNGTATTGAGTDPRGHAGDAGRAL